MHPDLTAQTALDRISTFHSEARRRALADEARRQPLQVKTGTPTIRERVGYLLVRWGLQLAGKWSV